MGNSRRSDLSCLREKSGVTCLLMLLLVAAAVAVLAAAGASAVAAACTCSSCLWTVPCKQAFHCLLSLCAINTMQPKDALHRLGLQHALCNASPAATSDVREANLDKRLQLPYSCICFECSLTEQ
jgi:hypothetical protein